MPEPLQLATAVNTTDPEDLVLSGTYQLPVCNRSDKYSSYRTKIQDAKRWE